MPQRGGGGVAGAFLGLRRHVVGIAAALVLVGVIVLQAVTMNLHYLAHEGSGGDHGGPCPPCRLPASASAGAVTSPPCPEPVDPLPCPPAVVVAKDERRPCPEPKPCPRVEAAVGSSSLMGGSRGLSGFPNQHGAAPPAPDNTSGTCGAVLYEQWKDHYSLAKEYVVAAFAEPPSRCMARGPIIKPLIQALHDVLDDIGVLYFVWAGTLVGIYREQDYLRWDLDADVVLFMEGLFRLKSALESGEACLPPNTTMIIRKGLHSNIIPLRFVDNTWGFYVDIMAAIPSTFVELNQGDATKYILLNAAGSFKYQFPREVLFPLQPCRMGNHTFWCPNQIRKSLLQHYKNPDKPDISKNYLEGCLPNGQGNVTSAATGAVTNVTLAAGS